MYVMTRDTATDATTWVSLMHNHYVNNTIKAIDTSQVSSQIKYVICHDMPAHTESQRGPMYKYHMHNGSLLKLFWHL